MIMPRKRLIDEIAPLTVSTYELIELIETLSFVKQSRRRLLQEAFPTAAYVKTNKVQRPDELWIGSLQRFEVHNYKPYDRWHAIR